MPTSPLPVCRTSTQTHAHHSSHTSLNTYTILASQSPPLYIYPLSFIIKHVIAHRRGRNLSPHRILRSRKNNNHQKTTQQPTSTQIRRHPKLIRRRINGHRTTTHRRLNRHALQQFSRTTQWLHLLQRQVNQSLSRNDLVAAI